MNGSYSAIIGGIAGDALEDFTGGVCEQLDLRDAKYQTEEGRSKLFNLLLEDQGRATLMGAAIEVIQYLLGSKNHVYSTLLDMIMYCRISVDVPYQ